MSSGSAARLVVLFLLFAYLRTRKFPNNEINKLLGAIILFSLIIEAYIIFSGDNPDSIKFYRWDLYFNGILYFFILNFFDFVFEKKFRGG